MVSCYKAGLPNSSLKALFLHVTLSLLLDLEPGLALCLLTPAESDKVKREALQPLLSPSWNLHTAAYGSSG